MQNWGTATIFVNSVEFALKASVPLYEKSYNIQCLQAIFLYSQLSVFWIIYQYFTQCFVHYVSLIPRLEANMMYVLNPLIFQILMLKIQYKYWAIRILEAACV
jgi:hypothetical protein